MGNVNVKFDLTEETMTEIRDLYSEGASDVEVKAVIRKARGHFSNDLWDRWLKDEPVFNELVNTGRAMSQAWWERLGRTGSAAERGIQPATYIFNMKNRFGWADKTEISGKDGGAIQIAVAKDEEGL